MFAPIHDVALLAIATMVVGGVLIGFGAWRAARRYERDAERHDPGRV